jgi:RHS repeat-associated protein
VNKGTMHMSSSMTEFAVCASRYTGKERDAESGNDYFGARYYGSSMGRFMSPDWSAQEEPVPYAKLDDPQSLNLYAYVLNNPLSHFDADGHACRSGDWGCNAWNNINQNWNQIHAIADKAVSFGKKAVDGFNGTLGFGKTNCSGGGSCSDAVSQATGAVVAGVLSDGESESEIVAKQLDVAETKIENIINNDLSPETLEAAGREAKGGMKVAGEDGKLFDHVGKVGRGIRGLSRQIGHLERVLGRSDIGESQATRINSVLDRARGMLREASQAITPTTD